MGTVIGEFLVGLLLLSQQQLIVMLRGSVARLSERKIHQAEPIRSPKVVKLADFWKIAKKNMKLIIDALICWNSPLQILFCIFPFAPIPGN